MPKDTKYHANDFLRQKGRESLSVSAYQ